jgi:hypothetical protein
MLMEDMVSQASEEHNPMQTENLPAGAIRCTSCGTVGYQTDKYCACCGNQLERSCNECGAAIMHPIAYYCTACGATLEPGRLPPSSE